MERSGSARPLIIGAITGLALGWLLPMLFGRPIAAWGTSLRDSPRLSDSVVGAGGLLIYIAEAPAMYLAEHITRAIPAEGAVNAIAWTLVGITIAAFILAIRRRATLGAGALGGLVFGWMLPAVCRTLGECFRHCWMHEGILGDIALVGGTLLRVAGRLAELPWRLLMGRVDGLAPVLAMPVSAAIWSFVGLVCAATAGFGLRVIFRIRADSEGDVADGGEK